MRLVELGAWSWQRRCGYLLGVELAAPVWLLEYLLGSTAGGVRLIEPDDWIAPLARLERAGPLRQGRVALQVVVIPRVGHEGVHVAEGGRKRVRRQPCATAPRRLLPRKLQVIGRHVRKVDLAREEGSQRDATQAARHPLQPRPVQPDRLQPRPLQLRSLQARPLQPRPLQPRLL